MTEGHRALHPRLTWISEISCSPHLNVLDFVPLAVVNKRIQFQAFLTSSLLLVLFNY